MSEPDLEARIQAVLPAFPAEVVREWLLPCANRHGWPPAVLPALVPPGKWGGILLGRSLAFWQNIQWAREERALILGDLDPESQTILGAMISAHFRTEPNAYSNESGGKRRVDWAFIQLSDHGVIPGRVVLLGSNDWLEVADGFHRLAAYFAYKMMQADPALRAAFGGDQVPLRETQPTWVGRAAD